MQNMFIILGILLTSGISSAKNPSYDQVAYDRIAEVAIYHTLQNLQSSEVVPGAVMASPSKMAPDYFYHWVRDAGISMNIFVSYYEYAQGDNKLLANKLLMDWVNFEAATQNPHNPSGGLGEPRFNVDGSANWKPWGRPQNDGPAIRARTMIRWAHLLLKEEKSDFVHKHLYCNFIPAQCPIKKDLEYVAHHWRESSFDLWEEVRGTHFFTRFQQKRALVEGASLAAAMGDRGAAEFYTQQAQEIQVHLQRHLQNSNWILNTLDQEEGWDNKTSNLDVATLLSFVYFNNKDEDMPIDHPLLAKTIRALEARFAAYPLNSQPLAHIGTAIGRYPEDVYDGNGFSGGNPWFLATAAYAEYYCRLGDIERAKLYFNRILAHTDHQGRMSEQMNRFNGFLTGAYDLTWSYTSYLSAYQTCFGKLPNMIYGRSIKVIKAQR